MEKSKGKQDEEGQEKSFIVLAAQRDELCPRVQTRTENALCHECVVHGDDVDLVDALRLEFVVLLDVSGRLGAACGRERPRHANLLFVGICLREHFSWTWT